MTSNLLFRKITLSEVWWIERVSSGKESSGKAIVTIQAGEVKGLIDPGGRQAPAGEGSALGEAGLGPRRGSLHVP